MQFYHLLASDMETIDTKTSVNTYLKNLIHYIHQNFLVAAKFVLSRVVASKQSQNVWVTNLRKTVEQKIAKKINNKG